MIMRIKKRIFEPCKPPGVTMALNQTFGPLFFGILLLAVDGALVGLGISGELLVVVLVLFAIEGANGALVGLEMIGGT